MAEDNKEEYAKRAQEAKDALPAKLEESRQVLNRAYYQRGLETRLNKIMEKGAENMIQSAFRKSAFRRKFSPKNVSKSRTLFHCSPHIS